jgi:hypothetical protein
MIYIVFSAILFQAIFENKIDPMPLSGQIYGRRHTYTIKQTTGVSCYVSAALVSILSSRDLFDTTTHSWVWKYKELGGILGFFLRNIGFEIILVLAAPWQVNRGFCLLQKRYLYPDRYIKMIPCYFYLHLWSIVIPDFKQNVKKRQKIEIERSVTTCFCTVT